MGHLKGWERKTTSAHSSLGKCIVLTKQCVRYHSSWTLSRMSWTKSCSGVNQESLKFWYRKHKTKKKLCKEEQVKQKSTWNKYESEQKYGNQWPGTQKNPQNWVTSLISIPLMKLCLDHERNSRHKLPVSGVRDCSVMTDTADSNTMTWLP